MTKKTMREEIERIILDNDLLYVTARGVYAGKGVDAILALFRENLKSKIGFLRQYLNENPKMPITNEDLEQFLLEQLKEEI